MEPIYKIRNRQLKQANPQNQCSMQSQYDKEQQRIDNKRKQIREREENMRKLHNGTYLEKREVYDKIIQVQKDFQNAREDRIKNDKQQERLLEYKGIAHFSEQEKKRQEKEREQKIKNQQNLMFEQESVEQNYQMPQQYIENKVKKERHYKKRNQLILELKKCNLHLYLIKMINQKRIQQCKTKNQNRI